MLTASHGVPRGPRPVSLGWYPEAKTQFQLQRFHPLILTSVRQTHSTAHSTPLHTQPPVPISTQVVQGALEPLGCPVGQSGRLFCTIFPVSYHPKTLSIWDPVARAPQCARVGSSGMYRSTTTRATNCKRLLLVSELWGDHWPYISHTSKRSTVIQSDPHAGPTLDQPIASRLLKASGVMVDGS